jgi:hypothetical protein
MVDVALELLQIQAQKCRSDGSVDTRTKARCSPASLCRPRSILGKSRRAETSERFACAARARKSSAKAATPQDNRDGCTCDEMAKSHLQSGAVISAEAALPRGAPYPSRARAPATARALEELASSADACTPRADVVRPATLGALGRRVTVAARVLRCVHHSAPDPSPFPRGAW